MIRKVKLNTMLELYDYTLLEDIVILPKGGGVYLLKIDNVLIYIGQAQNIQARLTNGHHVYNEQCSVDVVLIRDKVAREGFEVALISLLKPQRNIRWNPKITKEVYSNGADDDWTTGYYQTGGEVTGFYADHVRPVPRGQRDRIAAGGEDVLHGRREDNMHTGLKHLFFPIVHKYKFRGKNVRAKGVQEDG